MRSLDGFYIFARNSMPLLRRMHCRLLTCNNPLCFFFPANLSLSVSSTMMCNATLYFLVIVRTLSHITSAYPLLSIASIFLWGHFPASQVSILSISTSTSILASISIFIFVFTIWFCLLYLWGFEYQIYKA